MIPVYDVKDLRLMEFVQVMKNVQAFLSKQDVETLGLSEAKTAFDQKLEAMNQALKPLQKSLHTQQINDLDVKRGELLVGFIGYCKAVVVFPDKKKSVAAQKLVATIEKYGKNIKNKPLQEETAIIDSILKDFSEPEHKKAITTIDADKWVEDLANSNKQFSLLYNTRTQEQGALVVGGTKKARKELNDAYKHIVKSINALAYLYGKEKYQSIASVINEEIKQAKAR